MDFAFAARQGEHIQQRAPEPPFLRHHGWQSHLRSLVGGRWKIVQVKNLKGENTAASQVSHRCSCSWTMFQRMASARHGTRCQHGVQQHLPADVVSLEDRLGRCVDHWWHRTKSQAPSCLVIKGYNACFRRHKIM